MTTSTATASDTTTWSIDEARSELRFTARQMGMTVRGRFPEITGRLDLRLDRLEDSAVDALVRTASVEPAMPALRGLLLSDSFLAAEQHPELRFRSTRIEPDGDRYLVHGELTFRGERRAIALETRLAAIDLAGEERSARIEARGRVDRLMSDEELEIELQLVVMPAVTGIPLHDTTTGPARTDEAPAERAAPASRRPAPPAGSPTHDARPVTLVALVGSLRRGSLNRSLLRAVQDVAPASVRVETFSLAEIPFYDGDLEAEGDPVPVRALKSAIAEADALLIVTPEYNRGLPAVIKNAIDWASRPPFGSPLVGKPVLLLGATTGRSGTKYALQQAADSLAHAQAVVFDRRYGLSRAGHHVDDDGRLTDPGIRGELAELVDAFATAIRRAAGRRAA